MGILGCFPFNQNFKKFGNSGKQYRNFPDKFPEIPEIVEFPKYLAHERQMFLITHHRWSKRSSAAMSEEKRLPFVGYKIPTIQPKIIEIPGQNWMERNRQGIFQNLGIPSCEVALSLYTGIVSFFFSFLPCAGGQ